MSRQLKSNFSIAILSAMVSIALSSQIAQAATVGNTNIISSQNEPLSASIDISNIDADNFSANVAGNAVYEQMDMSTDVPVQVQFVKTSPSTGKLILTSTTPVTDPYADVVLVLNEDGKQQSVPKTLLLPINGTPATPSNPVVTPRAATTTVATNNTDNVAPVNIIEPKSRNQQFVMVGDSINPSLPTTQPRASYQSSNRTTAQNNPSYPQANRPDYDQYINPPASNDSQSNRLTTDNSEVTVTRTIQPLNQSLNNSSNSQSNENNLPSSRASSTLNSTPIIKSAPTTAANRTVPLVSGDNDSQLEILTTEINRKILLPNGNLKVVPIPADNATQNIQANRNAQKPVNNAASSQDNFKPLIPAPALIPSADGVEDNMIEDAIVKHARETPNASVINVNTPDTVPKPATDAETLQAQSTSTADSNDNNAANNQASSNRSTATSPNIGLSKVTYTVQRNDNLWTIANQIARRNRVDVETVMQQIQAYNPDAFIDGEARLLKANAKLAIPAYEVIPSRLGIRAATNARRSSSRTTQPTRTAASRPRRPATPRPSPRANVTLVTPGGSGSSTASGNGLSSALTNRVQQTRQQTANEARRVAGLNSQLTDYTHKLQLQNQRLSDLERRLKELRQQ